MVPVSWPLATGPSWLHIYIQNPYGWETGPEWELEPARDHMDDVGDA